MTVFQVMIVLRIVHSTDLEEEEAFQDQGQTTLTLEAGDFLVMVGEVLCTSTLDLAVEALHTDPIQEVFPETAMQEGHLPDQDIQGVEVCPEEDQGRSEDLESHIVEVFQVRTVDMDLDQREG